MSNCSYCLTCVIKCVSMFLSCLTKINDYIHNRDTDNQKFNQFDDLEISQKSKKKGLYSSRVTKEKPCVKRHSKTEASGVNVGAGVGVGADVGDDINKIAEKFVNDIVTKVIDDNDSNKIADKLVNDVIERAISEHDASHKIAETFVHNLLAKIIDDSSKTQDLSNNVKLSMPINTERGCLHVYTDVDDVDDDDPHYREGYDSEDSIQAGWKKALESENSDEGDLTIIDWVDKSDDGIVNIDISYIDAHNKSRTERKKSGNFNDRSEFDNLYRPEAIRSDAQVNYLDAEREPYNKKTYPEIDENTKEFVKRDLEQTRAAWARHSTRWV